MTIKHIAITSGGNNIFITLGILSKMHANGDWDFNNIETIYGISSGSFMGAILCLKIDFETINNYFMNRPYDYLKMNYKRVLNLFQNHGMYGKADFIEFFKPLLHSCDLTTSVTLKGLYDYSNIELNITTTNLNTFKSEQLSYKTCPHLKLIDAIYMSCNIPLLFEPHLKQDNYYIDGAILNRVPIEICANQTNCAKEELLGIKQAYENNRPFEINSIFDYIGVIMNKIGDLITHNEFDDSDFPHIKLINCRTYLTNGIGQVIDSNYRKRWFELGNKIGNGEEVPDGEIIIGGDMGENTLILPEAIQDVIQTPCPKLCPSHKY